MKMRPLGRTGIDVSMLCLGTMTFGEQNTEADGHAQMDMAVERGVNVFDMAELYPIPPRPETQGRTEEIVGSWLRKTGKRDEIVIASKVVGRTTSEWYRGGRPSRLIRTDIVDAVEKSLKRLGTDRIDLYQTHWPERPAPWGANPTRVGGGISRKDVPAESSFAPIEETFAALEDLVAQGKIRHFGLSNESSWAVMRYLAAAGRSGGPRVASIQNAYNLLNRTFEVNLAEVCREEGVSLLAYSPLAQGHLTGKYDHGALPVGSRKQLHNRMQRYETPHAAEVYEAYNALARDFGMEPALFANAFVAHRPFMTSSIIGATTLEQLSLALDSADVRWTEEMQKAVDDIHQRVGNPCP